MESAGFDQDILDHYSEAYDEDARLRTGAHQIEFLRTQELIRRQLTTAEPIRILDVGGGSGVHAGHDGERVSDFLRRRAG